MMKNDPNFQAFSTTDDIYTSSLETSLQAQQTIARVFESKYILLFAVTTARYKCWLRSVG